MTTGPLVVVLVIIFSCWLRGLDLDSDCTGSLKLCPFEPRCEKTGLRFFDLVPHKQIEDG